MALSKVTDAHVHPDEVVEVVQTPQEIRAEVARERREKAKERQLDRRTKRQNKRSQCF